MTTRGSYAHKLSLNYAKMLKTLFNTVEDRLKKLLNFEVSGVRWRSDGSRYSQEYKSFEIYAATITISMTEYHHWINCQAYGSFLTQQSMGENEYDKSGHLYFHFFEALNDAFEVQFFFRASFLHLTKDTDSK